MDFLQINGKWRQSCFQGYLGADQAFSCWTRTRPCWCWLWIKPPRTWFHKHFPQRDIKDGACVVPVNSRGAENALLSRPSQSGPLASACPAENCEGQHSLAETCHPRFHSAVLRSHISTRILGDFNQEHNYLWSLPARKGIQPNPFQSPLHKYFRRSFPFQLTMLYL